MASVQGQGYENKTGHKWRKPAKKGEFILFEKFTILYETITHYKSRSVQLDPLHVFF